MTPAALSLPLFVPRAATAPCPHSRHPAVPYADKVPQHERDDFMQYLFGAAAFHGETAVFEWMDRLCPGYDGGYWEFFEFEDGGGFLAPVDAYETLAVKVERNGYSGDLSAVAAGIVATLFALQDLAVTVPSLGVRELLAQRAQQLREYAHSHHEVAEIFRAIA